MIVIIDYEMGNVRSVLNAFLMITKDVLITQKREDIEKAEKIVLPGVGAFGEGMKNLKELGLIPVLEEQVLKAKKPFLGICVGMQLLADEGFEFGHHRGLGWIPGSVKRLEVGDLVLPHVGWNDLHLNQPAHLLVERLPEKSDFYFVHSYAFSPKNASDTVAMSHYGQDFTAIVAREHIFGVQFHPEKSQKTGKVLLENFVKL